MRSIASFASLLALGLLVAGILTVMTQTPVAVSGADGADGSAGIDFWSLLVGLLLGLVLANLSRISWTNIPRRVVNWVLSQEQNLVYGGIAAVLIAILIFY